jgi:hypothetical protein
VVEDVRRLGGFGIAAHPDSPKAALRWTDTSAPIDGIEWINADSEWRDESRAALVRAGVEYFFRPAPALALLLDRPSTLDRWDALLRQRRVLAFGAADAHGGPGSRIEDQSRTFLGTVGIPSYEASFRELGLQVVLAAPLTGDGGSDARALYGAVRRGDFYTVINALASPGLLDAAGSRVAGPSGASVNVIKAGACRRVEVALDGAPGEPRVPWIVGNARCDSPAAAPATIAESAPLPAGSRIPPFPWRIEKDAASRAVLRTGQYDATLEYTLAEGERGSQFVAMATDLQGSPFRAIELRLAADRPARVSVQLRDGSGRRWAHSYYVDPDGSQVHVPVEALRPVDGGAGPPDASKMTSLLLVVDLTNASPGRAGWLRVLSSAFQ